MGQPMKESPVVSRVGISLLLVDDDVELGEMMTSSSRPGDRPGGRS